MSRRSSSNGPGSSGQQGFTLVEVLVAVSILAIVLSSVYGVFAAVSATERRLASDSDRDHLARVVFDRLGRELHGAFVRDGDQTTLLRGGTDERGRPFLELTTTAATPMSMTGTGIARVIYRLADSRKTGAGGKTLLRGELSRRGATGAPADATMMHLASGIQALSLRFAAAGDWYLQWDSRQDGLPELVEVSLLVGDDPQGATPYMSAFELPELQQP
jgi:general secretion pathway protein J